ncbi:D-alanyl-D-alanine carboxypeptidase/D-alanyl-D-alanine endopeptidase [Kribbella sandramycini]|uniref:D-alanyl-D-alanine carboxypeptidase/D-alanyl-D-alanine-endopeptidase (Penicillin-binding protein 4) n=1 Tax=Kribbella sandramycini TaxID=60450 RepID=A0A841SIC6_9ACTN|nr:D-alanyl-D-alanine carboxypeptidase/D-alanyl-D-alanine-endopeptidase (penicillin-binding protein 4) [Kribbella sandramycini]
MRHSSWVSRRKLIAAGVVLAAVAGGLVVQSTGSSAQADETALQTELNKLLNDTRYVGSQVELVVRDAGTGEVLYNRNGGSRLMPASNTKLFTSAAAMGVLGPDFKFHTDVLATAPVRNGKLRGDLYLKGYGDPTTLEEDYVGLAKKLKTAGVTRVDGNLVADDSYFDRNRLGDGWSGDDESSYYSAQISALTLAPNKEYDTGTVIVETLPGAAVGDAVKSTLVPGNGVLQVINTATTSAAGSPTNALVAEREHGKNIIRISGTYPLGGIKKTQWVTVWEPQLYAADVFRRALAAEGIKVTGKIKDATTPLASARVLATDESMPLSQILTPFMKLSNNMHAEHLVKTMGAVKKSQPTWAAGLGVVNEYVKTKGVDTATIRLSDGSGLSRKVNVTGDAITNLLLSIQQEPWFQTWYNALPVAGNAERFVGGTLATRMANTPAANNLRAKTGSLTGATALGGFVTDKDGRKLVFSMMSNNYMISPRSVEDAVGVLLASWSEKAPPAAVAPSSKRSGAESTCATEIEWVKAC